MVSGGEDSGAARPRRRPLLPLILVSCLAAGTPVQAGPSVAEVVEVADIDSLAASPDGRLIAFRVVRPSIQRNSYMLEWHVANLITGRSSRVAAGGDAIYGDAGPIDPEPVFWSRDGRYFFHRTLVDGAIGIWRTAADGAGTRPVVVGDADVERLEVAEDGDAILYRLGPTRDEVARAEQREYDQGVLIDATVDVSQGLVRGASINGRMATQRLVGTWYARASLLWRLPRSRRRLDLATLATKAVDVVTPPAAAPLGKIKLDEPRSVRSPAGAVATLRRAGEGSTLEARLPGSEAVLTCRAAGCHGQRIAAAAWRPGHEQIVFTTRDAHQRHSLHLWELKSSNVRRIAGGEGLLAGSREPTAPCNLTREAAVCVSAAAVSPPSLERIDLATGRRAMLYDPNADLRARAMPQVEHLSWKLPDGRFVAGTLLTPATIPKGGAPIFIHYYFCPGYLRGGIGDEFPLAPLADAGFIAACVNMAPFDGQKDGLGRYRDSLASIEGLVALLAERGLVDRARVGMGGFSAGSEATMFVAMNSRLLAAAAIASPQYEPGAYWMNAVRGRDFANVLRQSFDLGSPEETPERWRLLAPALNVDKIAAPLLIQLPEQEVRHAMELYGRLSNSSTPVEMHAFPEEGHIKTQPRHRHASHRRYLDWFRYWLQGHVDPDAAKADQYRRWSLLRKRQRNSTE